MLSRKINIFVPGINQLYYVNYNNLTYKALKATILSSIVESDSERKSKISSILSSESKDSFKRSFREYKSEVEKLLSRPFQEELDLLLPGWVKSNLTYVNQKHMSLFSDAKYKILVYNAQLSNLLVDQFILSHNDTIEVEYCSMYDIKNFANDNSVNIFCEYSAKTLLKINSQFPSLNILLNTYTFCDKETQNKTEENAIVKEIQQYFQENLTKKNLYPDSDYVINKDINFISNNFYQLKHYYDLFSSLESISYDSFVKEIDKKKPFIVETFTRSLCRKQEFLKQKFYISDENVLYRPCINNLKVEVNGKFHCVLVKLVEVKDEIIYQEFLNNLSEYCDKHKIKQVNKISMSPIIVEKNEQVEYIENFLEKNEKIKALTENYNYKVQTPKSLCIPMETFINKNEFSAKISGSEFSFPLIIKYKGEETYFKHLITIIFNEEGYMNYIEFIAKLNEDIKHTSCVIQERINHGGYVIKAYHVGKDNYFDYRSSLIDLDNKKFISEFKEQFWHFKTIELESENYMNNIWKKYRKEGFIEKTIEEGNKKNFVAEVCDIFEEAAEVSLFGLDFLFDHTKEVFYVIDCNALPSFKIKGFEHDKEFRKFFYNYCK